MSARVYRYFHHKDSNLRIACACFDAVTAEQLRQYALLEAYIRRHPSFRTALAPLDLLPDAPAVARLMAASAGVAGVGPMAAVAGALAQCAAEAGIAAGCTEAIVENGGDIYLITDREVTVGIYAGDNPIAASLALHITPADAPLAICSSSSTMGHSLSLGYCDLATVVADSGALADAVATFVGNHIFSEADIEPTLNGAASLPGVRGLLAVKGERIGICGKLPKLVRNTDASTRAKITRDFRSQER
jgi:ApbE superfamily uncharacterized protein (UPF0280 family)